MHVQCVDKLFPSAGHNPAGFYKNMGSTALISMGGGAYSTIINPQSFDDGGPEWVCRYGNIESIRYTVASLLETFDYLLSDAITMKEATERLRLMRKVRADIYDALVKERDEWKARAQQFQGERADLADKLHGTPCAEIRWQHERDALAADKAELLAERDVWREKADNLAAIVGRWLALFDKHELGDAARALLDRHAAPAKGECL